MKALLTFIFSTFCTLLSAQSIRTTYHSGDGAEVSDPKKSLFYRTIAPDDTYPDLFKYEEHFTKNDQLKLSTRLTNSGATNTKIGACSTYYANGQLREKSKFGKNHNLVDTSYAYYQTGILYAKKSYSYGTDNASENQSSAVDKLPRVEVSYILIQDTLGNILAENGKGRLVVFDLTRLLIEEEGPILNHKKNGEWTGKSNKRKFKETWLDDKLISGVIQDSLGLETSYDESTFDVLPEYPGGIHALNRIIANNYRYPAAAIDAEVTGTVQIEFIVEKDGSMSSFKVRKELGHNTGKAGIDAVKKANRKWSPGIQRGIPVRVAYILPIQLNLSN